MVYGKTQKTQKRKRYHPYDKKEELVLVPVKRQAPYKMYRTPLGNKITRTIRYAQGNISLDPIAISAATVVFSANGLFQPNITTSDHQPLGFDQMMALYNNYTVLSATCRVHFASSDANYPVMAGIRLSNSSTALTDRARIIEQGDVSYTMLTPNNEKAYLKKYVDIGKWSGRKDVTSEDDYRGSSSANPSDQVYFHVFMAGAEDNNPGVTKAFVVIDYKVMFHEPIDVASS